MKAQLLKIIGRVQRVGYRRFVQELGQELGLKGYVRNEKDGTVTVFVQGEENQVEQFIEKLRAPPPPAIVRTVEQKDVKPKPKLRFFEIRYNRLVDELQEGFGAMQSIFMNYWDEFRDYRSEFRDFKQEFREFRDEFSEFRKDFDEFVKRMDAFAERVTKVLEVLTEESKRSMAILEMVARDSRETREMLVETMRLLREVASKVP